MGKYRRIKRWASAELNNATFIDYFDRLKSIAMNRFEWVGVPDTIDVRFLERSLFDRGYCVFFKDPVIGYLCLNANLGGQFTVYDIPRIRRVYTTNGTYSANLNEENSVIIWNNYLHKSDYMTTELAALRLSDIQRTIDVNIKGQKTPKLILANEEQRLAMKNLYMQWDGNEPFIFGDKALRRELQIEVLDTTAPYVTDKLEIQKHQVMSEYLTYLGIENANTDKKERLVADEVGGSYGHTEMNRNVALNAREEACKQINEMFGLSMSVRFKSEMNTQVNSSNTNSENKDKGGKDNG